MKIIKIVKLVQDRKTGEWYDPAQKFEEKMRDPDVIAMFKRLKER